jgi:hypothetical protein
LKNHRTGVADAKSNIAQESHVAVTRMSVYLSPSGTLPRKQPRQRNQELFPVTGGGGG